MNENKDLLLKSASTYGLALGIFWIIKFVLGTINPGLHIVFLMLTIATPFIGYYMTKQYRDRDLGGHISFFHAWRFGIMLYFFAALIVSVAHFIYFQYIADPKVISDAFSMSLELMKQWNVDSSFIKDSMQQVTVLSPIVLAIQGIFNNIFFGIVFSVPVAAIVSHNKTAATSESEN